MSDDVLRFEADFSQAIEEIIKVQGLSIEAANALKQWSQATTSFNNVQIKGIETLQKTDLVIKSVISDTEELTAVLHNEGAGWEYVSSKVKEVNNVKQQLAQVSKELAAINRDASAQAKQIASSDAARAQSELRSAQATNRQIRQDFQREIQQLKADLAQRSQEAGRGARLNGRAQDQVDEQLRRSGNAASAADRSQFLGQVGSNTTNALRGQLPNVDPTKIASITAEIGKLGTAAGLSTAAVLKLYSQVKSGDTGNIEGKYAPIIDKLQNLSKLANPKSEPLPTPNLDKLSSYLNILTRIQSTLINLALYRGFNILTNALSESVGSAQSLQTEISLIRTISQGTQQTVGQFADSIKRVSSETGFAAKDIAELFYDIASNQVAAGAAIEDVARKAAELARVIKATPKEAGSLLASVQNTYGQEAGSLDEISGKLFKTIDLGRINATQLDGALGKLTNTGKDLGVSFDEILASLSGLTVTGLKTDEAATLLYNAMKALKNPSKELSQALLETGASSGRASVGMSTLFGTFQKLDNLAKQGKINLADIFPDIREQRFFSAFSNDTNRFSSDLARIKAESGTTFTNAKTIRGESDTDKLQRGLEVFKNTAISTFGDSITKLVGQFIDLSSKTEDMEKKARSLFQVVTTGVATIVAYRTSITVLGTILELQAAYSARAAAATALQTAATNRDTAATVANNAAKRGGIGGVASGSPILAGAALVTTAIAAYSVYEATAVKGYEDIGKAYEDYANKVKSEAVEVVLAKNVTEAEKLKAALDAATKNFTGALGRGISNNARELRDIQVQVRDTSDVLKASFAGISSLTHDSINDTTQSLQRIRAERERIVKDRTQNGLHATEGVNSTLQQFANPVQQLQLIDNEFANLQKRIDTLVAKGTVEAFQEAEALQNKKIDLANQYYTKLGQLGKANFDAEYAEKQRLGQLTGAPGENVYVYHPDDQIKTQNRLAAEQVNLQDLITQKLKEQQTIQESKLAQQKIQQKQQQEAIKAYEDFSIYTAAGDIDKKFLDANGQLDSGKVSKEFNSVKNNLKAVLPKDGTTAADIQATLGIDDQIKKREDLLKQEVERTIVQDKLVKTQQEAFEVQKKANAQLGEAATKVGLYNEKVKELAKSLALLNSATGVSADKAPGAIQDAATVQGKDTTAGRIAARTGFDKYSPTSILNGIADSINPKATQRNRDAYNNQSPQVTAALKPVYAEIAKQSADLDTTIKAIPNAIKEVNGQKIIDPAAFQKALDEAATNIAKLRETVALQLKRSGVTGVDAGSYVVPGSSKSIGELESNIDELKKQFINAKSIGGQGIDISVQAANTQKLADQMNSAAKSADNLGVSLDRLKALIDKAAGVVPTPATVGPAPNTPGGQFVPGLGGDKGIQQFYGGKIEHKAYGGPLGQDTNMAWLADEEYVLNRSATRRFYSQVTQMNNMGRTPQYFSEGGVVTNMGGVKFNINGAGNPKQTAREVHNMLKRAKRAGTI